MGGMGGNYQAVLSGGETRASTHQDRKHARMYLLQCWFSLSDEGVEGTIYDSYAMRKFMGINFLDQDVPDAATLLHFRHLLEEHGIGKLFFDAINAVWSRPDG